MILEISEAFFMGFCVQIAPELNNSATFTLQ